MTRLVNAALITVVAFFVFLGVFWQFSGDGGEARPPGGAPAVTGVAASWQPAAEREMLLELQVDNPSSLESRVTAVSYEAETDGHLFDSAVARPLAPAVAIPGRGEAPVRIAVDLPEDFVLTWWPAYMADGEGADLRIVGTLAVKRDDGSREVGFEWRSSWQGELADGLSGAARNCAEGDPDVCLEDSRFFWRDGALHADLAFANPGTQAVAVRNTTFQLLFGDRPVVDGEVDLARTIGASGEAEVGLVLAFSPEAMQAWWPDHLARCERSPVALRMDLQVEPLDPEGAGTGDIAVLQWTFPAPSFRTSFVCAP